MTTVATVINTAIDLAQMDSSFLPMARKFYNLVMEQQSKDFDWPVFRKTTALQSFIDGTVAYDVPADFSRSDYCYLFSSDGQRGAEILILSQLLFDRLKTATNSGVPRIAYIDQGNGQIVFENSQSPYKYKFTYFRKGTLIDLNGANDSDDIDFDDENYFIKAITTWLMDYSDDDRADAFLAKADKKLREAKLNVYDDDANSVVDYASAKFKAGRRPSRGGGGSFWGP